MFELYVKAVSDYKALCEIVSKHDGTFEELARKLGGKNFDGDLFDCDYGIISTTIFDRGYNRFEVAKDSPRAIDVWDELDDTSCSQYIGSFSYDELVQKCCC